jgi:hypothetical protein
MSSCNMKRKKALWGSLFTHSLTMHNGIARKPLGQINWNQGFGAEASGGGEEEEDDMPIDEASSSQKQHLSVLNTIPITRSTNNGGRANRMKVDDDVPNVYLDQHWSQMQNEYIRLKFDYSNDEEDVVSGEEEEEQEEDEEDEEQEEDEEREIDETCLFAASPEKTAMVKNCKRKRGHDTNHRSECFLCSWGNKFHDSIKAKHVNILFSILDNYAGCANEELADQLVLYFNRRVYKRGIGMPRLTREVALEHIELHTLSAIIHLGESVKLWRKIRFALQNAIFKADGKYDKEALAACVNAQKMLDHLYLMDPDKMNFNQGKSREDTRKIGTPFHFQPELKQKAEKRKRTKKKQKLLEIGDMEPGFDL